MFKYILKRLAVLSVAAIAVPAMTLSGPSDAGQRYGTPPPAVLSADLTAPWLLQLRYPPAREHYRGHNSGGYQVQIARPVFQAQPYQRRAVVRPAYQQRRAVVRPGYHQRRTAVRPSYQRPQPTRYRPVSPPVVQRYSAPKPAPVAVQPAPARQMDQRFEPQMVSYSTNRAPGTIIIDTNDKFLYLVMSNGNARRYGVGVGKPGFEWAGTHKISRKAEWPDWRPPAQMIAREKKKGRILPAHVAGGPKNPLGARALYLGSSLYRIHGTNSPWTIGKAVSSGCIRMRNEDVMDLYERVGVGTRVIVS